MTVSKVLVNTITISRVTEKAAYHSHHMLGIADPYYAALARVFDFYINKNKAKR